MKTQVSHLLRKTLPNCGLSVIFLFIILYLSMNRTEWLYSNKWEKNGSTVNVGRDDLKEAVISATMTCQECGRGVKVKWSRTCIFFGCPDLENRMNRKSVDTRDHSQRTNHLIALGK